ncbi:MAG: ABC transporter permease [Gemmatimonadota bacterium]
MTRRFWRATASQIRDEVEEELAHHLAARAVELEAEGRSAVEAQREAARRLGDRAYVVRDCVASDLRRDRRARRREIGRDVVQDARVGVRQLGRRPTLALVSVLTLGVAIGATTAIYAVADHVLLRPLPYEAPERVVTLWETDLVANGARQQASTANYLDWVEAARSFSAMALIAPYSVDLAGEGAPEALETWVVTHGFFDALGVRPIVGRSFTLDEYEPNGRAVALISHAFWQRRFGGDAGVAGRTLTLDGTPHEIVGVLPPSLEYPGPRDVIMPRRYEPYDLTDRTSAFMDVVARLRDGVTVEQAQAELDGIAARMAAEHVELRRSGIEAVPLRDAVFGAARPAVTAMLGAVAFLLLIACANLANVLIARGIERAGELSLRGALGAGRARIARQLMTESLVLAIAGGAVGAGVAWLGIRALIALAPPDLPRVSAVSLDGRVLAFAVGTTLLTALLFGVGPALRMSRPDLMRTLRAGGGGSQAHNRLRGALVSGQVALCVVLLVGAGLLGRSMARLLDNELGFAVDGRASLQLFLWDNAPAPQQRIERVHELMSRFAAVPGIDAVGAVSALPFHPHAITARDGLLISGEPAPAPGDEPQVLVSVATPSYFDVMAIPLRRGRSFDERDRAGSPNVAIVNERFARDHFPGGDAVGRRIMIGVMSAPAEREIIGVVGDVRPSAFDSEPEAELFIPHGQSASGSMTFVVRTSGDAAVLLPSLRAAVWSIDRNQSIYHESTIEQLVSRTLAQRRFQLLLSAVFALLALALIVLGIYGVISLWARQRTVEFGIRMALGARAKEITGLVLRQGLRLAVPGIAAGLLIALAITRWIEHLLYGVAPTDLLTLVQVALVVVVVAAAAAWLPARAAAASDPLRSIRGG